MSRRILFATQRVYVVIDNDTEQEVARTTDWMEAFKIAHSIEELRP